MIDWNKVNELRDEVGAEDFGEVVELFLSEVEERLSQLGEPGRSLEHDLHFLKGSAMNLGFSEFSKICAAGETAAAQGNDDDIQVPQVRATYRASRAEFLASADIAQPS